MTAPTLTLVDPSQRLHPTSPTFSCEFGATPASLQNERSTWLTRNRYMVRWTVVDADEELEAVDVAIPAGVIGRRDDSSNQSSGDLIADVFTIDTKNPTVTAVMASDAAITASTVAEGTFSLSLTFSEAMDQGSSPALSFPNQDVSVLLTATTGSWVDSTHFTQSFQVNETFLSFAAVDVKVSGGRDSNGNLQIESTAGSVFAVALPVPTSTPTATPTATPQTSLGVDRLVLRSDNPRRAKPDGRLTLWASNVDSATAQVLMAQLLSGDSVLLEVADAGGFVGRVALGDCARNAVGVRCATFERGQPRTLLVLRRRDGGAYSLTLRAHRLGPEHTGVLPPLPPLTVRLHTADLLPETLASCERRGVSLHCAIAGL